MSPVSTSAQSFPDAEPTPAASVPVRNELEELRAAHAAALAENRAMVAFMGRFARDLLAPLDQVAGNARLVLETRLDSLQGQTVRRIVDGAAELTRPLRDLHQFAALSAGTFKVWPSAIDTREFFRSAIEPYASQCRVRGVEFGAEIAPEVPVFVHTDPAVLREALGHLFQHVTRATTKGEIELLVELRDQDQNDVCLFVTLRQSAKSAAGAKPADLFRPFAAPAESRAAGTPVDSGLGLALAANLVERLDGALWHEDLPAGGGAFHFALWVERVDPPHTGPSGRAG